MISHMLQTTIISMKKATQTNKFRQESVEVSENIFFFFLVIFAKSFFFLDDIIHYYMIEIIWFKRKKS